MRYSEDLDLVQLRPGPIGPLLKAIHACLDPWLGVPQTRRSTASHKLIYTFETESEPRARRKLKIEIQTREHFTVRGVAARVHIVENPWFSGDCTITTYEQDELLGTKLRALYQRRKGRDLFDLEQALERLDLAEAGVVECFRRYTEEKPIRRAEFERNLAAKLVEPAFLGDMTPLLAHGGPWSPVSAAELVQERLLARLPGQPWRGSGEEPTVSG